MDLQTDLQLFDVRHFDAPERSSERPLFTVENGVFSRTCGGGDRFARDPKAWPNGLTNWALGICSGPKGNPEQRNRIRFHVGAFRNPHVSIQVIHRSVHRFCDRLHSLTVFACPTLTDEKPSLSEALLCASGPCFVPVQRRVVTPVTQRMGGVQACAKNLCRQRSNSVCRGSKQTGK